MPDSPIASRRAPQPISTRCCSRASPRSPQGQPSRQSRASISPRSGAAKSGSSRNCRPSRGALLRGSVAVTLGDEKEIEGEIGAEHLALAPAFALALGAAGHDAAEPLGTGLAKGWRGRIAFQALRGLLPGGSELQPVSGVIRSDGQSL